jgi:ABC-type branched-subunit amino acid transport system substrate-binding protein
MPFILRPLWPLLLLLVCCAACAPVQVWKPPVISPTLDHSADSLIRDAEASYRRHAYRQAMVNYTLYLDRFPTGPQANLARLRVAELLGLQGDWPAALARYQAFLAREAPPEMALQARYGVGQAYFKLGQLQQATQVLDSLTAQDLPRSLWFSTQCLLAEIALKQNNLPQAFSRLRLAAQDVTSGDQEWFEDLRSRIVDQAAPGDLEHLANLYRDNPISAALLLRLARLAQDSGQPQAAREWLDTLKERFPNSPEAGQAQRLLTGGKVVLGCLLPLSGQYGIQGTHVQRGMELAPHPAQMELVFRDTRGEVGAAAQLVRDLAQDPNVLAILGPLTAAMAQNAAEAAQAAGTPLITMSQKPGLTQTGGFIFQAFLTPRQQVQALVRHAQNKGMRRFAALYPDSTYGRTFVEALREELAAQGGELAAVEPYGRGAQELNEPLNALKAKLPPAPQGAPAADALFIPDDPRAVGAAARLLANDSWRPQLLGTNLLTQADAGLLAAMNGVLFPEAFYPGDQAAGVQQFIAAYRQKYGEDPDYLAAQGYALVRLMGQAAASGRGLNRNDLPGQLLSLRSSADLPWLKGFNPSREADADLYLLTVQDGRVQMAP